MEALPKVCDYSEPMGILPAGTENFSVTNYAVNGSSFTPGQQIIVDLNNVGYLDPDSLIVRYKIVLGVPALGAAGPAGGTSYSIAGCPVYTPVLRLDTLFNSNVVESINNYNTVATALSNLQYSMSDKMGMQSGLGFYEQLYAQAGAALTLTTDFSTTNENTDGLTVVVTNAAATAATTLTYYFSAPLPCLLSNAEKLVPLNGTNIRLQFTLDSLANMCPNVTTNIGTTATGGGGQFSSVTISNFEVVYNQIQFAPHIERQMLSVPKIRIKTSSYATGAQTLAAGVTGTINLVYNLRYASIKAMLLLLGGNTTASKLFDSVDITSGSGSYNFQVNGVYYPQNPLSTVNNRSGILAELRNAMRDMYSSNNSMCIDNSEFLIGDTANTTGGTGYATAKVNIPAKFMVGVSTRKMNTPALFTGVSSQNSPITAIINTSTALSQGYTPILALYYDAIIEIDTLTKQVNFVY